MFLHDKYNNIKLRLKLFNSAISPTLLYSLETCPLTQHQLEQLDILQRKMLKKIVGWIYDDNDTWEEIGHRMKIRLESALKHYPIENWSIVVVKRKKKLQERLNSSLAPRLMKDSQKWTPISRRSRGHPRYRWDDIVSE